MLNRLLDLAVDSPCTFEVTSLRVPGSDEEFSEAGTENANGWPPRRAVRAVSCAAGRLCVVLQLWGESWEQIEQVKGQMRALVESHRETAQCELFDEPIAEK